MGLTIIDPLKLKYKKYMYCVCKKSGLFFTCFSILLNFNPLNLIETLTIITKSVGVTRIFNTLGFLGYTLAIVLSTTRIYPKNWPLVPKLNFAFKLECPILASPQIKSISLILLQQSYKTMS